MIVATSEHAGFNVSGLSPFKWSPAQSLTVVVCSSDIPSHVPWCKITYFNQANGHIDKGVQQLMTKILVVRDIWCPPPCP